MRTLVFDSQLLTTFQECPMKFKMMYVDNLRSAHPIEPLVKGDVLHTAFETYYKGIKEGTLSFSSLVEKSVEEARAKATLNGIDLDLAEEVIDVCRLYFEFWKDDDLQPIEVEQPFLKLIYESEEDNLRIAYAGKIDLVATATRYQWKPVPFDNKSTSRNQTPSGRSNQFFGYCYAINSNILVINRIGFQKTLALSERFKRIPLSYPKEYVDRWVRNTIKSGYRLAWSLDNDEWEETLPSCDKYSGCTFKPICESITPEAQEWKIKSEYIVGDRWDVTKLLELKKEEPEDVFAPTIKGPSSTSNAQGDDSDKGD